MAEQLTGSARFSPADLFKSCVRNQDNEMWSAVRQIGWAKDYSVSRTMVWITNAQIGTVGRP
jgi:hypothetical protein